MVNNEIVEDENEVLEKTVSDLCHFIVIVNNLKNVGLRRNSTFAIGGKRDMPSVLTFSWTFYGVVPSPQKSSQWTSSWVTAFWYACFRAIIATDVKQSKKKCLKL